MMAKLEMVGSLLGMGLTVKQVYLLASTDTLNTSSGPGTEKQTMIFLDASVFFSIYPAHLVRVSYLCAF